MANQQADELAAKLGESKSVMQDRISKMGRSQLEQVYIRLLHECADKDRLITQLETKLRTEQYMVGVREAEIAELRGESGMPERDEDDV